MFQLLVLRHVLTIEILNWFRRYEEKVILVKGKILILIGLIPIYANSQYIRPAIEPNIGVSYFRSIGSYYDPIEYKGVSLRTGLRAHCLIGNRIAVSAGIGLTSDYLYNGYFVTSSVRVYVFRNYQTDFSVFGELGGEISDWGGYTIPFYVGTSQYFAKSIAFNFRVRIPTLLDVKLLRSAGHIETGIEAGLQFDLSRSKPKKITGSGNPFILM